MDRTGLSKVKSRLTKQNMRSAFPDILRKKNIIIIV